jgi:1,4-alpha-glucan branching enzyme
LQRWVEDLNRFYREEKAMHERDAEAAGFEWIEANDADHSVASFLRHGQNPADVVLAVFNFTPVPRRNYRVGVPTAGFWREVLNGDAREFGGGGQGNLGGVEAAPIPSHGRPRSLNLTLPPLAAIFLQPDRVEVPAAEIPPG